MNMMKIRIAVVMKKPFTIRIFLSRYSYITGDFHLRIVFPVSGKYTMIMVLSSKVRKSLMEMIAWHLPEQDRSGY